MSMLGTFLQTLIVWGTIVYATYCVMRLTAYGLLWLIGRLSFKPVNDLYRHTEPAPLRILPKT